MDTSQLLARFTDDAPGGALDRLAALSLDVLLDSPFEDFLPRDVVVQAVRRALEGFLASPRVQPLVEQWVEVAVNHLHGDKRALGALAPVELKEALRAVLGRPFSPDKKVVLTVIDRETTRELVREILTAAVIDFAHKASAPVAGVAKGLGSLARFAGETMKSRSGGLGSLVGAVGGEVERQVEKRAAEFVDTALAGVFAQFADFLANPSRASEAAAFRQELMDGVLEVTLHQLGREVMNADIPGAAVVLREGLQRWLLGSRSDEQLRALVTAFLSREGRRTLRATLEELGLLQVAQELGREQLRLRLAQVTKSPAFQAWLTAP